MPHMGRRHFSYGFMACFMASPDYCMVVAQSFPGSHHSISHDYQPKFNPVPARSPSEWSSSKITSDIVTVACWRLPQFCFKSPLKIPFLFYCTFKFYSSGYITINVCVSYRFKWRIRKHVQTPCITCIFFIVLDIWLDENYIIWWLLTFFHI